MTAKDVIRQTYAMADRFVSLYVGDLDDAEIRMTPVEGMNSIAWQLGHLILSESRMLDRLVPGSSPKLPEGFDVQHGREDMSAIDPKGFLTKADYLELAKAQREATKALLDQVSEEELDAPGPEASRKTCPTVGSLYQLMGTHVLLHVGQFVAVRRALKKPVAL
ncbi:DinB family protein [Singulisphaera rosea]